MLRKLGVQPDAVVEPTCGAGAFLLAAAQAFPAARLLGWDINDDHLCKAASALEAAGASQRATLRKQDFFSHDWISALAEIPGTPLILGNPPWVTNAALGRIAGLNLPAKENFLGYKGMDARTGKSNFDISEWMLMRLLTALRGRTSVIAMLVKTSAARKVLQYGWDNDCGVMSASLYRIDSKQYFNASVDACLLVVRLGGLGLREATVFDHLDSPAPSSTIGMAGTGWVSDLPTYRQLNLLDGASHLRWRSGLKHDCAPVMELRRNGEGLWVNGLGEIVDLESDYLFPLLKCTDLARGRTEPNRRVIVTQRRIGEDTSPIASKAPRTWQYLCSHRERFEARKSRIYRGQPPFALFGMGDYAYNPWKVAVSGLHHSPRFRLAGPFDGKPVMFDDACYYAAFSEEDEARNAAAVLSSDASRRFLESLMFAHSKRPVTAAMLHRLDLGAVTRHEGLRTA
jgi:hypothetical protein